MGIICMGSVGDERFGCRRLQTCIASTGQERVRRSMQLRNASRTCTALLGRVVVMGEGSGEDWLGIFATCDCDVSLSLQ